MKLQPVPREDEMGDDCDFDRETLCANWRLGCNGVSDGAKNGYLQFCYDCTAADILLRSSAREGVLLKSE